MPTSNNHTAEQHSQIAIIGGGLMGVTLARKLSTQGHTVTVFEQNEQIGGLATWQDFGQFSWDKFYHVILPSDRHLIELIRELDLEQELQWRRTFTGFYVDKKMHSVSSNLEFLKFPLLSVWSKIRLGWTLLYGSRIDNWHRLESQTSVEWLVRISGRNTYEKLWRPLLLAKLGPSYSRVSAVFIWSYIKRLFSARDKSASAEQLGHVRGGYRQIFAALIQSVENAGGKFEVGRSVQEIRSNSAGRLEVLVDGHCNTYDKVICTSPVSILKHLVKAELLQIDSCSSEVEYLGVVCVIVVTTVPLVPFYVVNIADETIPFTGLIGMSNVVAPENTGGYHLTYLPRYILSTDQEFQEDDDYFKGRFLASLEKMLPDFDSNSIVSVHVNRANKVQPLQVLNYSKLVPKVETKHAGLFILNSSQFVNATLNNNEVVGAVNRFYKKHAANMQPGHACD